MLVFPGREAFRKPSMPFGMELDGILVVDVADKCAAVDNGVQIGWSIQTVNGASVSDEERAATKALRAAEEKAASRTGETVTICFQTEEPEHWTKALNSLSRAGIAPKKR